MIRFIISSWNAHRLHQIYFGFIAVAPLFERMTVGSLFLSERSINGASGSGCLWIFDFDPRSRRTWAVRRIQFLWEGGACRQL